MRVLVLAFPVIVGCSGKGGEPEATTPAPEPTSSPTPLPTSEPDEGGVVHLETADGLTLEADYLTAPAGAAAVVLLHMIPPGNDRSNWPLAFRDQLHDAGYAVLALDRRGAGGSDGVAQEAYTGPNGKLDVAAAVDRVVADGHERVAILGASNGTTSMIDYTVWAAGEGHTAPLALGFLTGGTYTENQTPMSALPSLPAVFTYSTAERSWSEAQRALDPGTWVFHEYPNGAHGTGMFAAAPEVADDLVGFLTDAVPPAR
ncbi:MAG: alpha/beta hydrolase [Myxococcota bacterium]